MEYDIVFEGGGARGIVFVGAMQEFAARGHRPARLLGTSAGAIVAVLTAAGYSAEELQRALLDKVNGRPIFAQFLGEPPPFSKEEVQASAIRALFKDVNIPLVPGFIENRLDDALVQAMLQFPAHRNFFALLERGGWYAADRFVAWLYERLSTGFFEGRRRDFGEMTLAEFYAATGAYVSVVTADTTEARLRVLNYRTAPNCPVVQAVRMSTNLPFIWPDVVWQAGWGAYLGQPMAGNVCVDGGLLSGFPIELFVSDEPYVTSLMGPKTNAQILGMLIDETLPVPNEPGEAPPPGGLNLQSIRIVQRINRMVSTMTGARDRMVIDAFANLIVPLPAKGYGTIEFDMSDRRRDHLVAAGRQAMRDWFDRPQPSQVGAPFGPTGTIDYANRAARALLAP